MKESYNMQTNMPRCPKCSALMRPIGHNEPMWKCLDCSRVFKAIGFGDLDSELRIREVN